MRTLLRSLIAALLLWAAWFPAARADTPITLFKSFAGYVNFTGTQETLRSRGNDKNACAVVSSVSMTLSGIPTGATVLAAYLYWAGSGTPDYTVTFDGVPFTAPTSRQYSSPTVGYNYFAGAADVTTRVRARGNNTYTASGLDVNSGVPFCAVQGVLGGFQLLVIYTTNNSKDTFRVLNVYEGFQYIRNSRVELTLANFLTPSPVGTGKVGHITWEGDATLGQDGENLSFNTVAMADTLNPVGNQFNSISNINDDQTSYGIDFDAYTIGYPTIASGQKSAKTIYESGSDLVLMNAEIIAAPNVLATDRAIAMVVDGPLIESTTTSYRIVVSNNGPLPESGPIVVNDLLPSSLIVGTPGGDGWTCARDGQKVSCTYDRTKTLAVGASLPPIVIPVTPVRGASGLISNSATVGGPLFDYYDANNTATVSVRTGAADFTPVFMFTDAICAHNKPFGDPEQPCNPVNFDPSLANTDLRMYITYVVKNVPTAMSNVDLTLPMKFALSCHNPTTNAGVRATYNIRSAMLTLPLCEPNGAIPAQASANWTGLNDIVFGANTPSTKVEFQLRYQDVGRVELFVSDKDARLGSTGSFVSRPEKLVLLPSSLNGAKTPASAADAAFVAAGATFQMSVEARMVGLTTAAPNFGRELEEQRAVVQVVATPAKIAGGGPMPAMVADRAEKNYFDPVDFRGSFGAFTKGVATGTDFAYDDVGVLQLDASLKPRGDDEEGNYLGSGNVFAASVNVGRFFPQYFNVVATGPMACVDGAGCPDSKTAVPSLTITTMAYAGQPFKAQVSAMGAANNVLRNYRLELARDVTLTPYTAPNGSIVQDAPTYASVPVTKSALGGTKTLPASTFAAGVGTTTVSYNFPAALAYSADRPAANNWALPVSVYLRADEPKYTDEVTSKRAAAVEGGVRVVSGRANVASMQSAADQMLSVPVKAQFYGTFNTFNGWYDSTADSSSSFAPATQVAFSTACTRLAGAPSCNLTLKVDASTSGAYTAGVATIKLAAPGVGSNGIREMWTLGPAWLPSTKGVLTYGNVRSRSVYTYIREMY